MKKAMAFTFVAVLSFLIAGDAWCAPETVRMVGSSTVFKKIIQPSMKGIEKEGIEIKEEIKGTGPGFIALEKGRADVLLASAELPEIVKAARASGWKSAPDFNERAFEKIRIYEDEILVITNYANKVKKLSAEQLRGIFSGAITNWKDVGGKDLPIMVVIPEKGRATRQVFQDNVMGGAPFVARCIDSTPTAKVDDIVRVNESAIGFTSKAFFYRGKLRIVDTVDMKRPLLLVTRGKPSPAVEKLGKFLSGKGRKYWEEQDLTPFWLMLD